jgi:hypothetical protein
MQGLGEGPDRVLAAGFRGPLRLLEREDAPEPLGWAVERQGKALLRGMAATNEVIVTCDYDGTVEIMRMDTPLGQVTSQATTRVGL